MKSKTKILVVILLLALSLTLVLTACGNDPATPVSIELTKIPDKSEYLVDDNLDVTGGVITVNYSNGETKEVPMTSDMVLSDKLTKGEKKITVTYTEGEIKLTCTWDVKVYTKFVEELVLVSNPERLSYIEGQSFDPTGISVKAIYRNGTEEIVTSSVVYDKTVLSVGDEFVVVSYGERYVKINITVEAKTVESLTMKKAPDKTKYSAGDKFDYKGLVLTVTYNNGETFDATSQFTFADEPLAAGTTYVEVSYKDYADVVCKVPVEVASASSVNANIAQDTLAAVNSVASVYNQYSGGDAKVYKTSEEIKADHAGFTFYVYVADLYAAPNAISLGETEYNSEAKVDLSLGNNVFVQDSVWYFDGESQKLYVSAIVLLFEAGDGKIKVDNAEIQINTNAMSGNLSVTSVTMTGNSVVAQSGRRYNVTLKNGADMLKIAYEGAESTDRVLTRKVVTKGETTTVSYGFTTLEGDSTLGYYPKWGAVAADNETGDYNLNYSVYVIGKGMVELQFNVNIDVE